LESRIGQEFYFSRIWGLWLSFGGIKIRGGIYPEAVFNGGHDGKGSGGFG